MLFTSLSAFTSAPTVTGCILKWEMKLLFCCSRRRAGAVRSLLVEEDTPSTVRVSWSQTVRAAAVLLTALHRQSAHLKQTSTPDMWPSPPTVVFKAETWAGTWEWKLLVVDMNLLKLFDKSCLHSSIFWFQHQKLFLDLLLTVCYWRQCVKTDLILI